MRRVALAVMAFAMAITGAVVTSTTPAGAAGVVDLSAVSASTPAAVSPPGALVFYTATFRNEGAVAAAGSFTSTTSGGTVRSHTAGPGCARSGNTVTCDASLAPGDTLTVQVVAQTPTTAGSTVTNTASARVNPGPLQLVDLVPANNDSTVSTPVQATTGVGSAAFVEEGGTLTYKKHVLQVRDADLGVVAYMTDTPAVTTLDCGGSPCQEGLRVDYDPSPQFAGVVHVDVNFGTSEPCRGLGNTTCRPLFFKKPGQAVQPVPGCATAPADVPCLESFSKIDNEFHFIVVMDTTDPDLLSPVKSLTSVSGG
jgi:hypothetical protein